MRLRLVSFVLFALASPPAALASVTVTTNAQRPSLRVDARGYAEVGWTSGGARQSLLIPPRGRALPGGRLPGRDVTVAAPGVRIPFQRVVRQTPDGRYWGLQSWRLVRGGATELCFSRWRGAATVIELAATPVGRSALLTGRATFHGRAVTGSWRTLEGDAVPHAAVLECLACMGKPGWSWFNRPPPWCCVQ